jgi:hypothetical protein
MWVAWTWLSPVVVVVAIVAVPSLGPGVRVWMWCWGILALWFALARTKTVTWRFVGLVGLAGAALAPLVGTACVALAGPLGLDASSQDAAVMLAPVEEVGKLLPLAALLIVARARARRFAVVDFLLVGFASGLGFQAVEDGLRRVWWTARPGGAPSVEAATGLAHYHPGLLPGWSDFAGMAFWPGHHVSTAVVTAAFGVAWWVRPRVGRLSWLLPSVLFAMASVDHSMTNVVAFRLSGALPGDHEVSPPGWLVAVWDAWGNGTELRPLLVSGLLIAIMLDVRRIRRVRFLLVPLSGGGWTHTVTDEAERLCRWLLAWSASQPSWQRAAAQAGVAIIRLGAWTVADLGQELAALAQAGARAPRRRRGAVPRRRRLMTMMTLLRQRRELGQELGRDVERAAASGPSGLAVVAVVAITCAAGAILVAVALAAGGETGLFMAGLFTAVGQWWGGMTTVQQVLAGVTGAAVVAFGGAGTLAGPPVAVAEDLLGGAPGGARGGALARQVVAFLTPAEAATAATTLTFAQLAPRVSGQADIDLDRLLVTAAAPGFMARRAADLSKTAALLGRPPLNSEHAGFTLRLDDATLAAKYPNGVPFTTFGFPDFAAYAVATVHLSRIVGGPADELRANVAAGEPETPAGHTWHRSEDCRTMLLVPTDLHEAVAHDGGTAVARARAARGPGS